MAEYSRSGITGRIIGLLLLIIILAGGGLLWLDYLNVIDVKTVLSPLYRFIGLEGRTQPELPAGGTLNLNDERYAILLEAMDLKNMEMDRRAADLQNRQGEIEQMAQELDDRQKALEEQEKSFNAQVQEADTRSKNVEQNARNLTGMPPERAVGILAAMDDQDVIDVLRKTEEIAAAEETTSIVPYWLSLLPPERAAELNRKMAARPPNL
ncbi:MAG: flagellar protein FlbB [Treponema sp.]|nr:flagellar protein FlbB [Treponema sp.]